MKIHAKPEATTETTEEAQEESKPKEPEPMEIGINSVTYETLVRDQFLIAPEDPLAAAERRRQEEANQVLH